MVKIELWGPLGIVRMQCFLILLVFALFSCRESSQSNSQLAKIIGKDNRYISNEKSSMIGSFGLQDSPSHCTAFAIAPRKIMTAAHCYLQGSHPSLYKFQNLRETYFFSGDLSEYYPESDLLILQLDEKSPSFENYLVLAENNVSDLELSPLSLISFNHKENKLIKTDTGYLKEMDHSSGSRGIFYHSFDTEFGSSGAPILSHGKVIGVHLGTIRDGDFNYGVLPNAIHDANVKKILPDAISELALFDDLFFGGAVLLGRNLFHIANSVGEQTKGIIQPFVIRRIIYRYLKDIPLTDEVRNRINKHIESEQMMDSIVPFLMVLYQTFQVPKSEIFKSFNHHISQIYSQNQFPGIKHSLFDWKPSKEKATTFKLDHSKLAHILALYDGLFLQGFDLDNIGGERKISNALVQRIKPILASAIDFFAQDLGDAESASEEVIAGARSLLDDNQSLEAFTISLITATFKTLRKFHNAMKSREASILQRERNLLKYLTSDTSRLWKEMESLLYHRKYSVHILVDGLQGQLVKSLSRIGLGKDQFLEKVYHEALEKEDFKPHELLATSAPKQENNFLEYLNQYHFVDENYLPFFRALFFKKNSFIIPHGISSTPTISIRNIPIAQTGAPVVGPGSTGLPNFHYVNRKKDRAYYFFGNDSLELDRITQSNHMKTIPDRFPDKLTMNCFGTYESGAKILFDPLSNLAIGESSRDYGEKICISDLHRRAKNQRLLAKTLKKLLNLKNVIGNPHWFDIIRPGKAIQIKNAEAYIREIARLEQDSLPEYLQIGRAHV